MGSAPWPAQFYNLPPSWVHQPPPCCESSPPPLPVSAPPTGLDECFFFISLVVGLPYIQFDFLSVLVVVFLLIVVVLLLVVGGGTLCLPMPPSWPNAPKFLISTNPSDFYSLPSLFLSLSYPSRA